MITSTILFDTDMTFWAVFRIHRNVVRRLTVIRTFGQPFLDDLTIGRCMIVQPAFEAHRRRTLIAFHFVC